MDRRIHRTFFLPIWYAKQANTLLEMHNLYAFHSWQRDSLVPWMTDCIRIVYVILVSRIKSYFNWQVQVQLVDIELNVIYEQ